MDKQQLTREILNFLTEIGIKYQLTPIQEITFLPGILIHNGELHIDEDKLLHPGDLLHEAGHIAITPKTNRAHLSGDVFQCGHGGSEEMAAIAWSWMALKQIGLQPEVLFHPE